MAEDGIDWERVTRHLPVQWAALFLQQIGGIALSLLGLALAPLFPFMEHFGEWQKRAFIVGAVMLAYVVGILAVGTIEALVRLLRRRAGITDARARAEAAGSDSDALMPIVDRVALAFLRKSYTVGPATIAGAEWALSTYDNGLRVLVISKPIGRDGLVIGATKGFTEEEKRSINLMPRTEYNAEITVMQADIVTMGNLGHQFGEPGTYTVFGELPLDRFTEDSLFEWHGLVTRALIRLLGLTAHLLERAAPFRLAADTAIETTARATPLPESTLDTGEPRR